ncbi:hypothetical protein DFJ77DRAFT_334837 [Powellomyces hirtus]|nr:hypothetical protein DFJ77DRAFT_334837 [Powellomyces hirtus]
MSSPAHHAVHWPTNSESFIINTVTTIPSDIHVDPPPGYPHDVQWVLHALWALQDIQALLWCIVRKRYLPGPLLDLSSDHKLDLPTYTFVNWNLPSRAAFYAAEMIWTNLIYAQPSMAAHHLCTMLLFYRIRAEPECVSVVAVLPFVLHVIPWMRFLDSNATKAAMGVYNAVFFICCTMVVVIGLRCGGGNKAAITNKVPLAGILVVLCNLWTYLCHSAHITE